MRGRIVGLLVVLALASKAVAGGADPPLISAVQTGDLEAVRTILAERVEVDTPAPDGMTALHWAVQNDDLAIVEALLAAGADVRAATRYGVEPINLAAINGSGGILRRLLDAGADPNVPISGGTTPLMQAARNGTPDAVRALLSAGAGVDAREEAREQTALMWAAAEGNAAAIEALVEAGADINAHSKMPPSSTRGAPNPYPNRVAPPAPPASGTPEQAITPPGGNPLVLRHLYPKARDVSRNSYGARTVTEGLTPLLFAARAGHVEAVHALLDLGADIEESASDGTAPLYIAIVNAHWELAAGLLERGANPNADGRGITPLQQLVVTRRLHLGHLPHPTPTGAITSIELARLLVAKGADLDARMTVSSMGDGYRNRMNRMGSTPFLLAAKGIDPEMMRLLVEMGADPFIPSLENTNALMLAAGVHQFNPAEDAGTEEESLEAVQYCIEELGFDVNATDDNGEMALHGSAYKGFNTVAQYLVDQGARLDVQNVLGWTPLTIANGVMYTNFYKSQRHTADLLVELMRARGIEANAVLDITGAGYVKDAEPTQEIGVPTVANPSR